MCGLPYNSSGVPGDMACAWRHNPELSQVYSAFAGRFDLDDDEMTGYPF